MKELDIHYGMPTAEEAMARLELFLSTYKNKETCIKIIHGYGSSGKGGKIKEQCRALLEAKKQRGIIKEYLPGEAIHSFMGYVDVIEQYKKYLQGDKDYTRSNDGVTFVFFR